MHKPFDYLAKKVGKEALDASGATEVEYEISRDAPRADLRHDPDPERGAERARLGLLGRIASVLCLIEVYAHAFDGAELRACMGKHFAHWEECERKGRARNRRRKEAGLPLEAIVEPMLWIIAATVSEPMLRKLEAKRAPGWPSGVYFHGDDLYRVGIVVADELPRDRSTLLVRIMAAGPHLEEALAELAALPVDALERTVADQVLLQLQHRLGKRPGRTSDEEEFMVTMLKGWDHARDEGRKEGEATAIAGDVLIVLEARGVAVPDAARERVLAQKDPVRLRRWLKKAVAAASISDVLGKSS